MSFMQLWGNHWKSRIDLSKTLLERYSLPVLQGKPNQEVIVVDVGCSIGTFAIEFAKMGYSSFGIDFDSSALEIARQLAQEENVSPEFICGDISDWADNFPKIDIAICFDIFEHLHDDELGALLTSIKRHLSKEGSIVFHTIPTPYYYIFFKKAYIRYFLMPFKCLSPQKFNLIPKVYSSFLGIARLLMKGSTFKESIKMKGHCNPTTPERLNDILRRAGYKSLFLESSNLYKFHESIQKQFQHQPITHKNLYGVAIPSTQREECSYQRVSAEVVADPNPITRIAKLMLPAIYSRRRHL